MSLSPQLAPRVPGSAAICRMCQNRLDLAEKALGKVAICSQNCIIALKPYVGSDRGPKVTFSLS